ncbi:MAG: dihydroorotate dehydrogenase [Acidimicrobiia bacterium]|nr:dihydroorotate dehydrogenase [Acidimicrobiia bacterium]MDH3396220.1 dihydroorotate dehydrogenase [Acidimicrobiia bacterium]
MTDLSVALGPVLMRSPLVAASGTVGSVVDFAGVGALEAYGAAVAKSVSGTPWPGNPDPRLASTGAGMLNAIGIQNPGVATWVDDVGLLLPGLSVPVWGSVVGKTVGEFVEVAGKLAATAIEAIEINLSCPNLAGEAIWALDAEATGAVVRAVRSAVDKPIGAKLSPNAQDIVAIARAALKGGADWLVLTNTISGAAIDIETRRPLLSRTTGGYSGPPLKPIALRCVIEVRSAFPEAQIVGCGGVRSGSDVVEYLLAGATAVAIGTAHFERPRIGRTIMRQVRAYCERNGVDRVSDLIGAVRPW